MLEGYQAKILLPSQDVPDLDSVKTKLQQVCDRIKAHTRLESDRSNCLTISISAPENDPPEDWLMRVYTNHEPHVLVESQEIAAAYMEPDDPRQAALATYGFRLEVSCDTDPDMDRFNYYVYVIEALASFPGAIVFDPTTTGFIE